MNPVKLKVLLKVLYEQRIDKYISENSKMSRSDAKKLIEQNAVFVNGQNVRKPHFVVKPKSCIEIKKILGKKIKAEPENIALDVVYEDNHIVVVNKKSGMVVHPAPGNHNGTLVNALLHHFNGNLSTINGGVRPGIVHRLDKDTSGLIIVAKTNEAHQALALDLKVHKIKRTYFAVVLHPVENRKIKIDLPVGRSLTNRKKMCVTRKNSKNAVTLVEVQKNRSKHAFVKCDLETGRTHQIRVHLSHINHPVYGDPVYGTKVDDYNQRLHAGELQFNHPITKKAIVLKAPLPRELNIDDFA